MLPVRVVRSSHARRRAVAAALVIIAVALVAVPARAHHGVDSIYKTSNTFWNCDGLSGNYCQTDNSSFTYFRQSSLDATAKANIATVLNDLYNPTDLSVIHENPPSYSGGSETDVIYQVNGSLDPFTDATTWCDDAINSTQCDQHYVAFRTNSIAYNNAIACHETGHAVGLTHGAQASPAISNSDSSLGCMAIPAPYSLGTHQISQINSVY